MKDPAIYKFETGTGYEIRPVIAPDGQAVVFDFHYLYTTQIREPVRADAKHLGRVKRHLIDTDVQLSNFELREVSRYTVALKAERTARGVPLLEDIPVVGVLWRPLPSREKSLQQNIIMAQATIFPTLFDLMNLRWAPEVAELDPLAMSEREFVRDNRNRQIKSYIDGVTKSYVDDSLGIPQNARRQDLYSPQATLPRKHPSGYSGPGTHYRYAPMQEGHQTGAPTANDIPWRSSEGSRNRPPRPVFPVMPGAAPQDGISGAVPGTGFAPEASFIPAQPGPIPAQMQNTPLGSNAPTTIQQPESIRARPTPRVSQPTIEELPSPRAGPQQVGQAAIVREAPILHSSSGITTSPPIDASRQIDTSRQNAEWQPARREYPK
jgi:hypothetical protein